MELTYKNVAEHVAKKIRITKYGRTVNLLNITGDTYSNLYFDLLSQAWPKLNPRVVMFTTAYWEGEEKNIVEFLSDTEHENSTLNLFETISYSTDIDTDEIHPQLDELIFQNQLKIETELSIFKDSISEVLYNVRSHTSEPYCLIRFGTTADLNYFDVAIGDAGAGIRATLSQNQLHSEFSNKDHYFAIVEAMKINVTSKTEKRGLGLAQLKDDFLQSDDDTFFLSSGDGYYMIDKKLPESPIRAGRLKFDMVGVQALLRFRLSK